MTVGLSGKESQEEEYPKDPEEAQHLSEPSGYVVMIKEVKENEACREDGDCDDPSAARALALSRLHKKINSRLVARVDLHGALDSYHLTSCCAAGQHK